MKSDIATITLLPEHFSRAETVIASFAGLTASTFRYSTGVAGLRIDNGVGVIELLPFQGQQIWDATFNGRRLTMGSMFDEPEPTQSYVGNYGGFLLHCGATAMGNPSPADNHPPHGELPNALYHSAELLIGEDEHGPFMGLSGRYRHTVAFTHKYVATPTVRLHAGSTKIHAGIDIKNLKGSPMDLMYLAHVNFRYVPDARIVDTVADEKTGYRIRSLLPPEETLSEEYKVLRKAALADPGLHKRLDGAQAVEPELVMSMDVAADPTGWSHALQVLDDGSADFISYRPDQLDHAIRWMVRNADQEAFGLVLPATAEPDGYLAEKAKDHIRQLAPGETFRCQYVFGALDASEAAALEQVIDAAREAGRRV
ncbi:DUF4432 family protein [Kaistia sp. 32K]|uniref:DUF4432 family protein n=1 Tax=Kaistia sp. 32K TaxID=2795690 RepID=UPI0019166DB1|nr:DUF4432 family protein [Kaistia sp. 32K]